MIRDLMSPIYIFGRADSPERFVTDLQTALARLKAGQNFFVRAGNRLYYANVWSYRAGGVPDPQVIAQLWAVLPPPEAMGL